tara:strand:+ start:140 stop:337 length:198 start_codon:yes stop_codon:yes gene_type:complete
MVFVYLFLVGLPSIILLLKIKNKEFDEPWLFISIIIWIILLSIFWYYMDWYTIEGWTLEKIIWKN